jgi:hypothetical protein
MLEGDEEAEDAGNKVQQLQDKIWEYKREFGIKSFLYKYSNTQGTKETFWHR